MKIGKLMQIGLYLVFCGLASADFDPKENLFMYLPMDDAATRWAYDTQGNMGGEIMGFTTIEAAWSDQGKFGGCFNGDGVQNRIGLASLRPSFATEAMGKFQNKTVAAWICPAHLTSPSGNTVQWIFQTVAATGQPYKFYIAMANGAIRAQATEGWTVYDLPVVDGNTWYHVAVVNVNTPDGKSQLRLFVDGVLRGTKSAVAREEVGLLYYPSIGAQVADNQNINVSDRQAFYGKIDEFRIYDAALTDAQVAELASYVPEPQKFRPEDNLQLYYTFDQEGSSELIKDTSGNNLWGVINNYDGNPDQWVNGVFGKSFNFDGTSNSVSFKDRNNEFAFGPFKNKTISCWINPNHTSGIQQIMNILPLEESFDEDEYKYYLYMHGALVRFHGLNCISGDEIAQTVGQITPGEWTHLAVTIRKSTEQSVVGEIYLNGIQDGFKRLYKNSNNTQASAFTIGAQYGFHSSGQSWFSGKIDDFRIYDKALSPSDVNDIYHSGPVIYGDINNDGIVNETDLKLLAGAWIDSSIETPATVVAFEKGGFEEYADQADLDAYWSDFGESASYGSTAMSTATLLTNPSDARTGNKALRWQYNTYDNNTNNYFTDLLFELDGPIDLTTYDYLSLWIRRSEGNAQQTGLYVKFLNDGVGYDKINATSQIITYEEGSTAHPAGVWENWLVDLHNLLYTAYKPVTLDNVQGLLIGCYSIPGYEGVGTIDIDDIELLTAPICSHIIDADINNDCYVDFKDYTALANSWLAD